MTIHDLPPDPDPDNTGATEMFWAEVSAVNQLDDMLDQHLGPAEKAQRRYLTADELLELNAAAANLDGHPVWVDGHPTNNTTPATATGRPHVACSDLRLAGLQPKDIPNVSVYHLMGDCHCRTGEGY